MVKVCRVLMLPAALTLSGCSFAFVDPPPKHPERLPPGVPLHCTTNRWAPIVDTVVTAFQGVRTALAVNANDEEYVDYPISRDADIAAGIALGVGFGVAAIWGHVSTSKCASLKAAERAPERPRDQSDASNEPSKTTPPPPASDKPTVTPPSPSWGR